MLALLQNATILSLVDPGAWFSLPNGDQVSPAHDGWTSGDFRLLAILAADPAPPGKNVVGQTVDLIDGIPRYVNIVEDAPPPPDPLARPLERLDFWLAAADVGVTIEGIRLLIASIEDPVERSRATAYVEFAKVYRRNDPLLITFAEAEGIPPSQLDMLWQWAAPVAA